MTSEHTSTDVEPSIFTRIIDGDLPGRFVWADDVCVAMATIEPHTDGHVLVIPRTPVRTLVDADEATVAHLAVVAQRIAATQMRVFSAPLPGLTVVGTGVAHLHLHVLPLYEEGDVSPERAHTVEAAHLDETMERLREGLRADGWGQYVPAALRSPALA